MSARELDLIARVLAYDDQHAFSTLVREHQGAVRAFLRRLTGGQHALADDLAQETFIAAYRTLHRFRGDATFVHWLLGIAYNRFRSTRRRELATVEWTGEIAEAEALPGYQSTTAPSPFALQHDLAAALELLPGAERAALHLCYIEGLTHEEAAGVLGCPLGTLKTHVQRAKAKLRGHLHSWTPA